MINWADLLEYMFLWSLFGIAHSIFASETVKRVIPLQGRAYRIFYNLSAAVTFLLISIQLPSITSILLKVLDLGLVEMILFGLIFGLGLIITSFGLMNWNIIGFVGLGKEEDPLNTSGIYSISRHPVYSGIILIFLSTLIIEVSAASLSWIIGAGGYFVLGSIPEENKLRTFHSSYNDYKINVGRFFPWKVKHFKYITNNLQN
ncbi:MAG: hypothetical protein GPJ54_16695 [Candidatus Heimdallarchaeota archaeon]|nr:hypothetical protein [Candidatus Heimdallarchaeota archaeon]